MSNMELIQSMSRERLANFLEQFGCPGENPNIDWVCVGAKFDCVECWERWLMRAVEDAGPYKEA